MIQPQAQPQPQQSPAPVQPQGQPPQAQSAAPAQLPAQGAQGAPSGRKDQPYNPKVLPLIEQHLNQLPQPQQAFLTHYMTPELAILFGIVLGQEALDYFKKFADPKLELIVQPRQGQQGGAQQPAQGQPPAQAQAQPQQAQGGGQPQQPSPQQQPQAQSNAPSIMGV